MNHMDRLIIFYFSGTGNSRRIALWLSELALENNIPCCSYDIATTDISNVQPIDNSATIVLISPVHGFNFPEITLNFIRNLPKVYITIEKYTIFQLKSIPVLIVCEDKKSYLNAG